ncbi:hypothetical protein COY15_03320, partial [Candidatus Roizmanbacteria bacterium CG_4_10_14_0_2_um_filter_39_12]
MLFCLLQLLRKGVLVEFCHPFFGRDPSAETQQVIAPGSVPDPPAIGNIMRKENQGRKRKYIQSDIEYM